MSFTCFGEILWDIFPNRRCLGGAPLNVAYYLNQLGNDSQLISAVGADDLGLEALGNIRKGGLSTDFIARIAEKETGQVLVTLDAQGCAEYEFKADAAWDYIPLPNQQATASGTHTLIFGSLAGRSASNLATLEKLLPRYTHRVFDLNLRPPFDDLNLCHQLMQKADLIKMNDEELDLLCAHLKIDTSDLESQLAAVLKSCKASSICVTRGSKGAVLMQNQQLYSHRGYPSKVADTVGAGDAFLAGLTSELAKSSHPQRALSAACAIGSLVAATPGAQTPISPQAIDAIISA